MTLETFSPENVTNFLTLFSGELWALLNLQGVILGGAYSLIIWYRNRHREKESLDATLLEVSVSGDNEIKIDAAEQMFTSFASCIKAEDFHSFILSPVSRLK